MAAQRTMLNIAIAVGAFAAQGVALAEEYRGTMEQQMACTPDVFRLCGAQISRRQPDRRLSPKKYRAAQRSLSAVFESNDSMQQPAAPGRRQVQPRSVDDDE